MKSLLISEIFPPTNGGSGRWFRELYSRLDKNEYHIAAGQSEGNDEFDQTHTLPVTRLDLTSSEWGIKSASGLRYYWRCFNELRKLAKQQNISAIHCGRCLPEGFMGYLLSRWLKVPLLCFIHGEDIETASLSREQSLLVKMALKQSTALVCNSNNTASLVTDHWGIQAGKVHVLHPGVDTTKFIPADPNNTSEAGTKWQDRRTLLTVGRLQQRKGHDMLIKALPRIQQSVPDISYAIIGDGEEKSTLQKLVAELKLENTVQFLAEVTDDQMLDCYQQCDIFVLPNRTIGKDIEGFGMVLIEAQSCGKPVVAGDSGGTRETMLPGTTGHIMDCTSVDTIADTIITMLSDEPALQSMGQRGRQHVVEQFDWVVHTRKARALFSTLKTA